MSNFVKVATVGELSEGERKFLSFDEVDMILFCVEGGYYAIEDVCTHDGAPLGDGVLDGCAIMCMRHGAQFDVRTGAVLAMPAVVPVPTYEVKVEGEAIYVDVPEDIW